MAPRKKMQKYLRKSDKTKQEKKQDQYWHRLYSKTFKKAKEHNCQGLLEDLKTFEDRPEKVLRKHSIISENDIDREFPSE